MGGGRNISSLRSWTHMHQKLFTTIYFKQRNKLKFEQSHRIRERRAIVKFIKQYTNKSLYLTRFPQRISTTFNFLKDFLWVSFFFGYVQNVCVVLGCMSAFLPKFDCTIPGLLFREESTGTSIFRIWTFKGPLSRYFEKGKFAIFEKFWSL